MAGEHVITLQPGTLIAGRYEVVKCLGAGSMGLVYACRHRELAGHLVAIKVLFTEVAQDSVAAARFRNEIVASYGVSHPNVVRAYEYFRDGDLIAYSMEYIGGGDLASRLERLGNRMPFPELLRYLAQIASGVQAIHDAGIVHRDLKPENILLTENNDVKITDFGIARTGHGPKLTEHGGVVGTIDYVSPEYLENGQVDSRSDIYAIGILAYEMVAGESPFRGDSVIATMTMRLRSDAKPPSQLRPDCPLELERIILRAIERDPNQRYQRSIEMFNDLQPLLERYGVAAGSIPSSRIAVNGGAVPTKPKIDLLATPSRADTDNLTPAKDFVRLKHNQVAEETVFEPDFEEPSRMESVLSSSDGLLGPHGSSETKVAVMKEGIDAKRLRTLSQSFSTEKEDGPLWLDLLTIIVAVIIGLGITLAVCSLVFPGFLNLSKRDSPKAIKILDD